MSNILKWLENIWNLRKIFDKYLPKIREIAETIRILQEQLADLRQAKIDLEKELEKMKSEQQGISAEEKVNVTVDEYYDPQLNVEYTTVEVNGDKAEPLFKYLCSFGGKYKKVKWNFTKFLVNKHGMVIARFEPTVKPADIEESIVKALGE